MFLLDLIFDAIYHWRTGQLRSATSRDPIDRYVAPGHEQWEKDPAPRRKQPTQDDDAA